MADTCKGMLGEHVPNNSLVAFSGIPSQYKFLPVLANNRLCCRNDIWSDSCSN